MKLFDAVYISLIEIDEGPDLVIGKQRSRVIPGVSTLTFYMVTKFLYNYIILFRLHITGRKKIMVIFYNV